MRWIWKWLAACVALIVGPRLVGGFFAFTTDAALRASIEVTPSVDPPGSEVDGVGPERPGRSK